MSQGELSSFDEVRLEFIDDVEVMMSTGFVVALSEKHELSTVPNGARGNRGGNHPMNQ